MARKTREGGDGGHAGGEEDMAKVKEGRKTRIR